MTVCTTFFWVTWLSASFCTWFLFYPLTCLTKIVPRISPQCTPGEMYRLRHLNCQANWKTYPELICMWGCLFWSRPQCLHYCVPASFLPLDWQEKYSQQDTQSQNNCVCNRPTPAVSSSPQETSNDLQYLLFMNCLRSCPREIQGSLVCHDCWCIGCTVECPSCNIVHNRQGIPSNETIHQ